MLFKIFHYILIIICVGLSLIIPYLIIYKMDLDHSLNTLTQTRYNKSKFNLHVEKVYKLIHYIMIFCFIMGAITTLLVRSDSGAAVKIFWYIVMIVTFYSMSISNFNAFRYRMKLAAHDSHEWVMLTNYVCGMLILMSVVPTFITFTLMLLKNGLLNPIDVDQFHAISGIIFHINIDRMKEATDSIFHPFTYAMFMCFCNAVFNFKDIYNGITERNLRYQYIRYWFYTVMIWYLIKM